MYGLKRNTLPAQNITSRELLCGSEGEIRYFPDQQNRGDFTAPAVREMLKGPALAVNTKMHGHPRSCIIRMQSTHDRCHFSLIRLSLSRL